MGHLGLNSSVEIGVVIVVHNSSPVLKHCLKALDSQSLQISRTVIIDCKSDESSYLDEFSDRKNTCIHRTKNIGFGAANNLGLTFLSGNEDYVLFLNPDAFPEPDAVEKCTDIMGKKSDVAVLSGVLHGFDIELLKPNGLVDSAGIIRRFFGRWVDRGMGEHVSTADYRAGYLPAVCGAFMFCRGNVVRDEMPELFDESFFMYKEDIELCIRLRKKGWKVYYSPNVEVFHCRGWNRNRKEIAHSQRIMAAENEIRLYRKHPSVYMVWAVGKYLLVKLLNI